MIKAEYLHSDITQKVIGCAMRVHNAIGAGFPEVIYQRGLQIELNESGVHFEREKELVVFYKNHLIGRRRVDFLIEQKVLLEIKAVYNYELAKSCQLLNYLEVFHLPVGLLINFGKPRLEFKRYIKNDPPLRIPL
jgi:GxxExxY protein